jgi:hypothetical protein
MKQSPTTTLRFVNANICIQGDSNESKSSYRPVLHSKIWTTYRKEGNLDHPGLYYFRCSLSNFCAGIY